MNRDLERRLSAVRWKDHKGSCGNSLRRVPADIRRLFSAKEKVVADAALSLSNALNHQYVDLSTAAEPALPFILEALVGARGVGREEILDMLMGFARATSFPSVVHPAPFQIAVRSGIRTISEHLERLTTTDDGDTSELAEAVLESLVDELGPDGKPPTKPALALEVSVPETDLDWTSRFAQKFDERLREGRLGGGAMLSGTSTEPPYDATTVHFRFWLFDEPGAIVASLMELQRLGLPDRAFVRQRAPVEQSLEYPPGF